MVVMQVSDTTVGSVAIKARLRDRLQWWRDGGAYHAELVDDTVREMRNRRGGKARMDLERAAKAFDSRVRHGKIRSAVQTATSRAGGGVLMPDGQCTKSGRPVMEVLAKKHPPLMDPVPGTNGRGAFEPYAQTPVPSLSDATKSSSRKLQGS